MYQTAASIVDELQKAGYAGVLAGGCVRDMILGLEPHDYDIATSAKPNEVAQLFPDGKYVGENFGVYLVTRNDFQFEIATFRKDGEYTDGRHPDNIRFCSMEEDASRRDFTCNALFYDPIRSKTYDFVQGYKDIKNSTLRFVGNPKDRVQEDHIRLLRAVRFSSRFGFEIHKDSMNAIFDNAYLIKEAAQERVGTEITKILSECKNSTSMMELFYESGLIDQLLPELVLTRGCEQPPEFHPEGDVWTHTLLAMDNMESDEPEALWAAMLHDVGKPIVGMYDEEEDRWRFNKHDLISEEITEKILKRFKFSNDFISTVCDLVSNHMKFMYVSRMRVSKLRRFLAKPRFDLHLALHKADCLACHGKLDNYRFCERKIKEFVNDPVVTKLNTIDLPKPLVTGHDLIELGWEPSPRFRTALNIALDIQLEGGTREECLNAINNMPA